MLFACFFSCVKSVLFNKQHATPHQTHAFIRFQASIGLLLLSYTFWISLCSPIKTSILYRVWGLHTAGVTSSKLVPPTKKFNKINKLKQEISGLLFKK
jgi:hypothetical protein